MSDKPIYPHTAKTDDMPLAHHLCCNNCGKRVSSAFIPLETPTPDRGLIVRAWIECPECMSDCMADDSAKLKGADGKSTTS